MPEKDNKLSPNLYSALELAFKLHGHDARKKSTVPYMAHLLSVCALVQLDGGTEEEAIAALLHDALADKPEQINREQIRSQFGEKVLEIIQLSSDTPDDYTGGQKPPWKERKQAYIKHLHETDASLLRVTLADKIDNARAILADHQRLGDKVWGRFNAGKEEQLWYYRSCLEAIDTTGFTGPLLIEFQRLVDQLVKQVSQTN